GDPARREHLFGGRNERCPVAHDVASLGAHAPSVGRCSRPEPPSPPETGGTKWATMPTSPHNDRSDVTVYDPMLEPATWGSLELPNRTYMAPMGTHTANPDGTISPEGTAFLVARARGG